MRADCARRRLGYLSPLAVRGPGWRQARVRHRGVQRHRRAVAGDRARQPLARRDHDYKRSGGERDAAGRPSRHYRLRVDGLLLAAREHARVNRQH